MTLRVVRGTMTSRVFAVVALAAVVILAFLPSWGSISLQRKMVELLTLVALAVMWNLLAGFAGVVSVGQQAFVGLGAYSMIALVNVHHENLYWSVLYSGLVTAVLSIPVGLIAFRLRGSYFAIGTWVLAEAISLLVILQKSVGAGNGVSLKVSGYALATRQDNSYWFALVVGVGAVLLTYLVLRSRLGLQMQAIRDSEDGARGSGGQCVPHALPGLGPRCVLDRIGGGDVLPAAVARAARRYRWGIQRRAMDRADHLHRRDRWHRHHRGSGDRRRSVLLAARPIQGPPDGVPDLDGSRGDCRRLAPARWHLGNDPPQAGRRPVPRPPPPGRVALSSVWHLPGCLEGLHTLSLGSRSVEDG